MSTGIEAELRAALTERAHDVPAHVEERLRGIDYRPRSQALDPRVALATGAGLAATGGASSRLSGWAPEPPRRLPAGQPRRPNRQPSRRQAHRNAAPRSSLGRGGRRPASQRRAGSRFSPTRVGHSRP